MTHQHQTMCKDLHQKHLILGVTGGISAYKSAELCRRLQEVGATVQVVMTPAACQFITPLTFQALSGRPVIVDAWEYNNPNVLNGMPHIEPSRCADAIIIAPATADFMAKVAHGLGNDALSNLCLARNTQTVPLFFAPAMNVEMWHNPATQRNYQILLNDGVKILGPASGHQACGEVGLGRLLEPEYIVQELIAYFKPKHLKHKRVLITAGATFEAIDPVRGITNISSGKMGLAIAQAAWEAGAIVTVIGGIGSAMPSSSALKPYYIHHYYQATSAQTMLERCLNELNNHKNNINPYDIFLSVAAVADWTPTTLATQKLKKVADVTTQTLTLTQTPDILATIAQLPQSLSKQLYCVGFAAETEQFDAFSIAKRLKKQVPLLVGNDANQAMQSDYNALTLYDDNGIERLPLQTKLNAGRALIQAIAQRMSVINDTL